MELIATGPAVGVGDGVGLGVGEGVGLGVHIGVGDGVGRCVALGVGVGDAVAFDAGEGVAAGDAVGEGEGPGAETPLGPAAVVPDRDGTVLPPPPQAAKTMNETAHSSARHDRIVHTICPCKPSRQVSRCP